MPVILGVNDPQYTAEELEEFREKNEAGITYEGKHYTLYEASQRQRRLETSIRNYKRRILIDEHLGDKDALQNDQIRLVRLREEYNRFSKAAGLPMQHERMEAAGFTWKHGKAAEKRYIERVAEVGEAAATQNWHTIPVSGGHTETKYRRINRSSVDAEDINKIIDDNVRETNPAYKNGGPQYRQNCQRCVVAYEMRRRGYDVIAKPAVVGADGKLSERDPLYKSWNAVFKGARLAPCFGNDGGYTAVLSQMQRWDDGAVAMVTVQWKSQGAHVFIAQNINGTIRFVDPQTGNLACQEYFTNARNGATMIARIDQLEPTELVEKCIKNRGGKS